MDTYSVPPTYIQIQAVGSGAVLLCRFQVFPPSETVGELQARVAAALDVPAVKLFTEDMDALGPPRALLGSCPRFAPGMALCRFVRSGFTGIVKVQGVNRHNNHVLSRNGATMVSESGRCELVCWSPVSGKHLWSRTFWPLHGDTDIHVHNVSFWKQHVMCLCYCTQGPHLRLVDIATGKLTGTAWLQKPYDSFIVTDDDRVYAELHGVVDAVVMRPNQSPCAVVGGAQTGAQTDAQIDAGPGAIGWYCDGGVADNDAMEEWVSIEPGAHNKRRTLQLPLTDVVVASPTGNFVACFVGVDAVVIDARTGARVGFPEPVPVLQGIDMMWEPDDALVLTDGLTAVHRFQFDGQANFVCTSTCALHLSPRPRDDSNCPMMIGKDRLLVNTEAGLEIVALSFNAP